MPISIDSPSTETNEIDAEKIIQEYLANSDYQRKFTTVNRSRPFKLPLSKIKDIDLSGLPIGQISRGLENQLARYLIDFGVFIENNQEVAGKSYDAFMVDVKDTIQSIGWQIYWLGVVYVCLFDGLKPKPTIRDLKNVTDLTDTIVNSIDERIANFLKRENKISDSNSLTEIKDKLDLTVEESGTKNKPKSLSLPKQFRGLATVLATGSINMATIDKALQISEGIDSGGVVNQLVIDGRIKKIQESVAQGALERGRFIDERWNGPTFVKRVEKDIVARGNRKSLHWVVWITKDDDGVCTQYCKPLEGQKFLFEERKTPLPIRDTHPFCRCRYIFYDRLEDLLFLF